MFPFAPLYLSKKVEFSSLCTGGRYAIYFAGCIILEFRDFGEFKLERDPGTLP